MKQAKLFNEKLKNLNNNLLNIYNCLKVSKLKIYKIYKKWSLKQNSVWFVL